MPSTAPVDIWRQTALQYISYFGQVSLALIGIGLTVSWVGYVNRSLWTWVVQLVITAWVSCLPIVPMAGPILRGRTAYSFVVEAFTAILQLRIR